MKMLYNDEVINIRMTLYKEELSGEYYIVMRNNVERIGIIRNINIIEDVRLFVEVVMQKDGYLDLNGMHYSRNKCNNNISRQLVFNISTPEKCLEDVAYVEGFNVINYYGESNEPDFRISEEFRSIYKLNPHVKPKEMLLLEYSCCNDYAYR